MKKNIEQKFSLQNQKGFSLVQVLAVAAMVGVMGTIITKTVDNVSKTQKAVGISATIRNLEETARRALLQSDSCVQTFTANPATLQSASGNMTFNSIKYGGLADPNKPDVLNKLAPNNEYGWGGEKVRLNEITIEGYNFDFDDAAANIRWATVNLRLRFLKGSASYTDDAGAAAQEKHRRVGVGGLTIDRVIPNIRVGFDLTTDDIVRCSTTGDDVLAQSCASLDGELVGGTCYNIKIRNISAGSIGAPIDNDPVDYAIIARGTTNGDGGGSIKAEGSVIVGSDVANIPNTVYNSDDTGSTADGSMFVERFLFVGDSPLLNTAVSNMEGYGGDNGSARVTDDLIVGASSSSSGDIYSKHNLLAGRDGFFGDAVVIDSTVNAVTIGSSAPAWVNASSVLRVQGGEAEFYDSNIAGTGDRSKVTINDVNDIPDGSNYVLMSVKTGIFPRVEIVKDDNSRNIVTYDPVESGRKLSELGGLDGIKLFTSTADNTMVVHADLEGNYTTYQFNSGSQAPGNTLMRARNEWDGTRYIWGTGGGPDETGDNQVIIGHGDEADSYRPSYIVSKMPLNTTFTGTEGNWNYEGYEIPNKDWAAAAVAHSLSEGGAFDAFLANISEGVEQDPMEEVKRQVCISMKIDVDPNAGVTWQRGDWTAGTPDYCNMGFVAGGFVCGDAPGDPCPQHFSTNYSASGNLTVAGLASFNGNTYFNDVVTFTGDVTIADGAALIMASDKKFKREVKTLDSVLDKIDGISGVNFNWKKNGRKDIGFIAQDLKKVYPELVVEKNGKNYVAYQQMNAVAIQAYKELKSKNTGLKRDLASLKKAVCSELPSLDVCR